MEPFGTVVNAAVVCSALKDYYQDVRDSRDDIQNLYRSVNGLRSLLERVQNVNRGDHLSDDTSAALFQAQSEIVLLEKRLKLDPVTKGSASSKSCATSALKFKRSLTWPFSSKEVEKILETLERCKSSIGLEIGVEQLSTSYTQFDIIADIRSEIVSARDDTLRRQIITWLEPGVNPSEEHNLARQRHQEATGSWLVDDIKFQKWLVDSNSFLWLYGGGRTPIPSSDPPDALFVTTMLMQIIAGAGKSILCSTVIDHVQERCKNDLFAVVVYWYFTFTDTKKQDIHSCLRSLIAGIYRNRRDSPPAVQAEYERSNFSQHLASIESLLQMLREVVAGLDSVYIVLDALDECPKLDDSRSNLLSYIREIVGCEIAQLHILTTSRRETDISESFDPARYELGRFQSISIQGVHVESDIKRYLENRLQETAFRTWKPQLKRDVETKLATQADGMFRLVALQLDALSKLKTESKIRAALIKLPKTLDSFYNRILLDIDEEDQDQAFRALQFIALAPRPLTVDELAEAIVVQPEEEPYLIEEDRFMCSSDILSILPSGLVVSTETDKHRDRSDPGGYLGSQDVALGDSKSGNSHKLRLTVQFAHFSVKEYLLSERLSQAPTSQYTIREIPAHQTIAKICLAYLVYAGNQHLELTDELYNIFPFLGFAANSWPYHLYHLESRLGGKFDECLHQLAVKTFVHGSPPWNLLSPSADAYLDSEAPVGLKDIILRVSSRIKLCSFLNSSKLHPAGWISRLGLRELLGIVLDQLSSTDLNYHFREMWPDPYHTMIITIFSSNFEIVKLLLDAGLDPNIHQRDCWDALYAACFYDAIDIASILLEKGADPNAQCGGFFGTALESACARDKIDVARLLLENGADPNVESEGSIASGQTALESALNNWMPNHDMIRLLIQSGADVNLQSPGNGSPLGRACSNCWMRAVEILLEAGANILDDGFSKSICQSLEERLACGKYGPREGRFTSKLRIEHMVSFLKDWIATQASDEQPDMLACLRDWKARHWSGVPADEEPDYYASKN